MRTERRCHRFMVLGVVVSMLSGLGAVGRAGGLQDAVDQASSILRRFQAIPEESVPAEVFRDAEGLAILRVVKAGFIFSGSGGQGVVIARSPRGWTGPTGISVGGFGFGFQAGAQVSELILVLNTSDAVKMFGKGGTVTLGGDLSVALGPMGRSMAAGVSPRAAVYSYSRTQGVFGGISLEGMVLVSEPKRNAQYYGMQVSPIEVLEGRILPPSGARQLLGTLEEFDRVYGIKPGHLPALVSPVR